MFSLYPHVAHQPTDGCTTPTSSHCFPGAGQLCGPPGGPSDPDNNPDNDLPNLFNDRVLCGYVWVLVDMGESMDAGYPHTYPYLQCGLTKKAMHG